MQKKNKGRIEREEGTKVSLFSLRIHDDMLNQTVFTRSVDIEALLPSLPLPALYNVR